MAAAAHRARLRTQPPGFAFYLASVTLILLCVQVMIYVLVLRETIGPFSIFGAGGPPHPQLGRAPLALVLDTSDTDAEGAGARLEAWRSAAAEAGIPMERATRATLPEGLARASVVVLPHPGLVDASLGRDLLSFVDQGHSLVVTG